MRVLILGGGAVGSYIGARLMSVGADVFFIVRGARLEDLSAKGLVVRSPLGDFTGAVNAGSAPPQGFLPDVAIVACKAPALDGALQAIAPYVGPETRLLPLLNGLSHLEELRQRLPEKPVLGGLVHGALTLRGDGVVEHLSPFLSLVCGPTMSSADPIADSFVDLLQRAGVDARVSGNIQQDMWNKFVFLTTLAGATCLMRASIGDIVATRDGEGVVTGLLAECLAVAEAEGFAPDETSMSAYRRTLTERGSSLTSSMLRDVLSKRRTEADHILGDMLRRARRFGIETPVLKIAHVHLQCYEATFT
jgi:2-dehydropantoate 2-reductase